MIEFKIDGINYEDCIEDLESLEITLERKKERVADYAISTPLKATSRLFRLISRNFFSKPCEGRNNEIIVEIVFDCCEERESMFFKITPKTVDLCILDCVAEFSLLPYTGYEKCSEYLRERVWYNDGFDKEIQSPKVPYVIQNKNFYLWTYVLTLIFPIVLVLETIETALSFVIKVLLKLGSFLGLISKKQKKFLQDYVNEKLDIPSLDNYISFLTGAGNFHFAPYVHEIFKYNIRKANEVDDCSIELKMPILEGEPYKSLAIFQSQNTRTAECSKLNDSNFKFFKPAAYNRTTVQLMHEIAEVFMLDVVFKKDGTIVIDTPTNILNAAPVLLNVEQEFPDNADEAPWYYFLPKKICKVSSFEFAQDGIDVEGNRALRRNYSDAVLWDKDLRTHGTPACKKTFKFGATRLMNDYYSKTTDSLFDSDGFQDKLRKGEGITWLAGVVFKLLKIPCLPIDDAIIMTEHVTSLPKLIILEPNTDRNYAKVFSNNSPLHIDKKAPYQELIKGFLNRESPMHPEYKTLGLKDFTVGLTKDMVKKINANGTLLAIDTLYGKGLPKKITLKLSNCTMTVSGVELSC